ncbi:hypothetical protein C8R43DRAFT_613231 [Mycena crocata]|nr:hypothetical protein C8R43DRAFT_613231 [Mycena crocata]
MGSASTLLGAVVFASRLPSSVFRLPPSPYADQSARARIVPRVVVVDGGRMISGEDDIGRGGEGGELWWCDVDAAVRRTRGCIGERGTADAYTPRHGTARPVHGLMAFWARCYARQTVRELVSVRAVVCVIAVGMGAVEGVWGCVRCQRPVLCRFRLRASGLGGFFLLLSFIFLSFSLSCTLHPPAHIILTLRSFLFRTTTPSRTPTPSRPTRPTRSTRSSFSSAPYTSISYPPPPPHPPPHPHPILPRAEDTTPSTTRTRTTTMRTPTRARWTRTCRRCRTTRWSWTAGRTRGRGRGRARVCG